MKLISTILLSALTASTLLAISATPAPVGSGPKVTLIEAPGSISGTTTIITTATVQKINKKSREITLKRDNGKVVKIVATEDVRNFSQIKVGDIVTTQLTETLDIRLVKGASGEVSKAVQESSSRAKLGEKPQRSATRTVASRTKVTKIDPATQTIILEGQDSKTEVIVKDVEQFKLIAVDDMIDTVTTETVAISVASPKK